MIRSLAGRLTLLQQISALVVVTAFGLLSLWLTGHALRLERRSFVANTATRLAHSLEDELAEEPDTVVAARGVVEDGVEAGVQVEVRAASKRLLASSRTLPRGGRDPAPAPLPPPSRMDFRATAVGVGGARITVVASDQPLRATLPALGRALLLAALPIWALSLLLSRSAVARAIRPLSTMTDRAASLSVEHHPRTLGTRSGLQEIDRLAESFDHLLGRLDDALQVERRLTADASHELRTPLTVLSGELELLTERASPDSVEALGVRRATEQVAAMRELVEAILLLHRSAEGGRRDAGGFEVLNLGDLLREALAEAGARHPGRESDVELNAPDEILVHGHLALLTAALRNLLDNAFKFTAPGDRIRVELAELADRAVVIVDDQGPGVPDAERERIFDPFYRGAEARGGTPGFGLGLPILRRIARAHGGDAEVTTSPLGGARFTLGVPRLGGTADDARRGPMAVAP